MKMPCLFARQIALLFSFLLVSSASLASGSALSPTDLKVEYSHNPLGIDALKPRLSWRSTADGRGALQTAYHIQAARTEEQLASGDLLWDSGRTKSDQSLFIPYAGPALQSTDRVVWRVRLWDQHKTASEWSQPAFWEMGLLNYGDWQADWITSAGPVDTSPERPVAMFRKGFELPGKPVKARLYMTAQGIYEARLNGNTVGDQLFTPGWTSYSNRIQYQSYDVTHLLQQGPNALGALLADGWYRGFLGWDGKRNLYGDQTALKAQLHITLADGQEVLIGTDNSWRVTTDGPYRMADIYNGETYDARREITGWSKANFNDSDWPAAALKANEPVALVAPQGPPVRRIEELSPVSITQSPNGETLVDFGQNMVGWVRLKIKGRAGDEIQLRHAEVLDPEGNIYTENLRGAAQIDRYIVAGRQQEAYEPRFTFHGFRYVSIKDYPGTLKPEDISGVVIHSDMQQTASWTSSHPELNQLYNNIIWGQKGNFLDVPTDCPQRDERLGWTGDAQVFAPTAALNMDVSGFMAKWMRDLSLDQTAAGSVPHVVPNVLGDASSGTAGWSDAATVVPWSMYQAYGDTGILQAQFTSMQAWVDYVASQAGADNIWRPGFQYGDWLAPSFQDTFDPYRAITGVDLIATAYFAHSADLLARSAKVLGKSSEARRYRQLFEGVRKAFQKEFVTRSGRLVYETQTAYVLALDFDLLPEEDRAAAAARLAADVKARNNHLTTGFLGTPQLTRVLSDHGHTDVAYDLLTQTSYPSWLYPVTFGATTIWERWDAIQPDGQFQNPEMTSFNHYAYGAVGEWMMNVVAGIDTAASEPGYQRLTIHPQPGGGLRHVKASLDTPYGPVASHWYFDGAAFNVKVTVAANTRANIILPLAAQTAKGAIKESGLPLNKVSGVASISEQGSDLSLELGSGSYHFRYHSPELKKIALDFQLLTEDSAVGDLLRDPTAKQMLESSTAGGDSLLQIPAKFATMSLRDIKDYVPNQAEFEKLIKALPAINAKRLEALESE